MNAELITRTDIAHELHVCLRTVDRWRARGWIAPIVDTGEGGTVLYRREVVDAMRQSEHKRGRPRKSA